VLGGGRRQKNRSWAFSKWSEETLTRAGPSPGEIYQKGPSRIGLKKRKLDELPFAAIAPTCRPLGMPIAPVRKNDSTLLGTAGQLTRRGTRARLSAEGEAQNGISGWSASGGTYGTANANIPAQ
jgi:hypothetical protein